MDWISVKDRLPKPRVEVLVHIDNEWTRERALNNLDYYSSMYVSYMCHALQLNEQDGRFYENGPIKWNTINKVTHWMPLPEAPKE